MELKDLIFSKNKKVSFTATTGTVFGVKKWNESIISSSRGGGYVGPGGGTVIMPKIRSSNVPNLEFWIKTKEDNQVPIKLKRDIPITDGQKVTVVSVKIKTKKGNLELYETLINHSADKYWKLTGKYDVINSFNIIKPLITGFDILAGLAIVIASYVYLINTGISMEVNPTFTPFYYPAIYQICASSIRLFMRVSAQTEYEEHRTKIVNTIFKQA